MIINSTYTEGPTQVDGRRYVTERHTDESGAVYEYEWLGDQEAGFVVEARATVLNKQLAARAAAEALVVGTLLPLTKLEFRELFTAEEQYALDEFEATYEVSPSLDAETRAVIRTGYKNFENAGDIARPFDDRVLAMLNLFVILGLLTDDRRTEIVSAGNG
jgi:hypothetical protein